MVIDFPNEVDIALNYTKAPEYYQAGKGEREGGERGGREGEKLLGFVVSRIPASKERKAV